MPMNDFYVNVIGSDDALFVQYLQENGLLSHAEAHDPGHKCSSETTKNRRETDKVNGHLHTLRCIEKGLCRPEWLSRMQFEFMRDHGFRQYIKLVSLSIRMSD